MPDWGSPVVAPEPNSGHTVRPHAPIVKQWAVAVLAFVAPILVALYWLTVPGGNWPAVLATHLVLTVAAALGVASYNLVSVTAGPAGLRRRDGFGRISSFPTSSIGRVLHVNLRRNGSIAPHPHIFVLGTDGHLLTRLHGAFWPAASIETVLTAISAPVERHSQPMTLQQFDRTWPGLLHPVELRFLTSPDDDDDALVAPAP